VQRNRSVEDLLARAEESTGNETVAIATPGAFVLPEGEPADTLVVIDVTAIMRQVIACFNTGNPLTFYDFTTDQFLRDQLDVALQMEATPADRPTLKGDQLASLMAVREVTVLPDGRVGALVETHYPTETPDVQVDYVFLVEEDFVWLIDDVIEDLEDQYPPTTEPADPPVNAQGSAGARADTFGLTSNATLNPTPAPTATAIPTQAPTATPQPTQTPTATPAPTQTPIPPPSTMFGIDATVVTTADAVNLRAGARIAEPIVAVLPLGTLLTVTGPSEETDDFVWWPVVTETGQRGFVAEQFLAAA
jgi:hypothetical protein